MTGISRKLPDTERTRLKAILKEVVPDHAGVIVRTAAEGASRGGAARRRRAAHQDLGRDQGQGRVGRRQEGRQRRGPGAAARRARPDRARHPRRVQRGLHLARRRPATRPGATVSQYVEDVAPDLGAAPAALDRGGGRLRRAPHRRALAKAMDRKVWLPSGGSLVIDRTEAMTVVDVNTGKFIGSGRQPRGDRHQEQPRGRRGDRPPAPAARHRRHHRHRLHRHGAGVQPRPRRCAACSSASGRDRTKHQVAEVTSLGLVQMTRKRVGPGLVEVFSEQCEHCGGRGIVVHTEPIDRSGGTSGGSGEQGGARSGRGRRGTTTGTPQTGNGSGGPNGAPGDDATEAVRTDRGPDRGRRARRGPAPRRGRRARPRPSRMPVRRRRARGGRARPPSTPRPTPRRSSLRRSPSSPRPSRSSSRRRSSTSSRSSSRSPCWCPTPSRSPSPSPCAGARAVEPEPEPPRVVAAASVVAWSRRRDRRVRRHPTRPPRWRHPDPAPLIWRPTGTTGSLDSRCAHRADVPCRKRETHQPVSQRALP